MFFPATSCLYFAFQTNACHHSISLHQQHANEIVVIESFTLLVFLTLSWASVQVSRTSWRPVLDSWIRLWMQGDTTSSRERPPPTAPAPTSTPHTWAMWVLFIWHLMSYITFWHAHGINIYSKLLFQAKTWISLTSSLQMRLMGECRGSIDAVRRAEGELTEDEDDVPGLTNPTSTDTQSPGQLHTNTHISW